MTELTLTPKERQQLKGRAHGLDPVVLLGAGGLSPAVIKEIDRALDAHELIKVRVPGDDRDEREAMFGQLAEQLAAARVQSIGKLLVLFRPRPGDADDSPAGPAAKPRGPGVTRPRKAPPLPKKAAGQRGGASRSAPTARPRPGAAPRRSAKEGSRSDAKAGARAGARTSGATSRAKTGRR